MTTLLAVTREPVDWVLAAALAVLVIAGAAGLWLDRGDR
jgi:hypothetical protein